jgi:hypothetical protein
MLRDPYDKGRREAMYGTQQDGIVLGITFIGGPRNRSQHFGEEINLLSVLRLFNLQPIHCAVNFNKNFAKIVHLSYVIVLR